MHVKRIKVATSHRYLKNSGVFFCSRVYIHRIERMNHLDRGIPPIFQVDVALQEVIQDISTEDHYQMSTAWLAWLACLARRTMLTNAGITIKWVRHWLQPKIFSRML